MAKERIEKMLIILDEAEVEKQVCRLARGKDAAEILQFVSSGRTPGRWRRRCANAANEDCHVRCGQRSW